MEVVDLDEMREKRRIEDISDAFRKAAVLAISDWGATIIIGTLGDDVHVIYPEDMTRFEILGVLQAAAQKFSEADDDDESAA